MVPPIFSCEMLRASISPSVAGRVSSTGAGTARGSVPAAGPGGSVRLAEPRAAGHLLLIEIAEGNFERAFLEDAAIDDLQRIVPRREVALDAGIRAEGLEHALAFLAGRVVSRQGGRARLPEQVVSGD